jgi:hypothetical protein
MVLMTSWTAVIKVLLIRQTAVIMALLTGWTAVIMVLLASWTAAMLLLESWIADNDTAVKLHSCDRGTADKLDS